MRMPIFLKDVATLAGGKGLAITISMLSMPIISRLFQPEMYGTSALYVSVLAILATVGTLSFPQAIILPKKEKSAAELFLLSLLCSVVWAMILWLALATVWLQTGNPYPDMGFWIWTLPIATILTGLLQAFENWLTRNRRFKISAAGNFSQTAFTSGSRIAWGLYYGSQLWPLIAAYLLGLISRLLIYSRIYPSISANLQGVSLNKLRATAREFKQFPRFNMPAALTFSLNAQLPVLVIGYLFTARDTGHYAMVQGLLVTTTMMVGESVRRVYLHRVTQNNFTAPQLRADYRKMFLIMLAVALIPAAILIIYGEGLFSLLLGKEWSDAGRYAAVLTPWFVMQWLSMPASALVIRLKKQRFWFWIQQMFLYCQLMGMIVAYMQIGTVTAVLTGYVIARVSLLFFLIFGIYMMINEMNLSENVRNKKL